MTTQDKDFDCTVIGDVFLDISVQVSARVRNQHFQRGGTSYCNLVKAVLGGAGNVAVGLSLLGARAAFVGKAGHDLFGKLYLRDLNEKQVAPNVFFDREIPTGSVIIFVEKGYERSFLVSRGANDRLSLNDVEKASALLKKSKYVYFCGYSLVNDPQRTAILEAIERARKFGAKIVFDPGAYNIVKSKHKFFIELLNRCHIFSPNFEEAAAITNTTNIENMITELRDKVPLTALKYHSKGCILITKKETVKVPASQVRCVDPTGAGDAFAAALIYGLTHEMQLESVGKLANWFAAQVVTQIGSRSFPSKLNINRFLKEI